MEVALPIAGPRRAWRWLSHAASAVLLFVLAGLLALAAAAPAGYTLLIEQSDSMSPVMRAGDLLFVESARPADVRVGDIVTFSDHTRQGDLVTHRVIRKIDKDTSIAFVTKGDANTGVERWAMDRDGTLGVHALTVPKLGFLAAWFSKPTVRLMFLPVAALLLGGMVVRRIWA